jgi:hypothetical protein
MNTRSHDSHAIKLLLSTIKNGFVAKDETTCFKQLLSQEEFRIQEIRTVMGYIDVYSWAKAKSMKLRLKPYFELG